jgi:hypothetical protein
MNLELAKKSFQVIILEKPKTPYKLPPQKENPCTKKHIPNSGKNKKRE